ncbi:MAG TPA: hypothetical protein VD794_16020 [Flavisolibacter sp.]|nr:hypothetical protein [Flavisolibacter sp.]
MIYTIKSGKHRASPLTVGFFINKRRIRKYIRFLPSCRYALEGADKEDVNKLFGLGYLWHHHKDSARFGWVYNPQMDRVDIFSYCYIDGSREIAFIARVNIGEVYEYTLEVKNKTYYLSVRGYSVNKSVEVPHTHHKKLAFPLGFWFGGNNPAPHTMQADIKTA